MVSTRSAPLSSPNGILFCVSAPAPCQWVCLVRQIAINSRFEETLTRLGCHCVLCVAFFKQSRVRPYSCRETRNPPQGLRPWNLGPPCQPANVALASGHHHWKQRSVVWVREDKLLSASASDALLGWLLHAKQPNDFFLLRGHWCAGKIVILRILWLSP